MNEKVQIDWKQLIEIFLNRDESISPATFCTMHNVSIKEMDLHYKEFMKDKISTDKTACVEITGSQRKAPYLILDVDGVRIKVNRDFDHSLLREVLKVIKC